MNFVQIKYKLNVLNAKFDKKLTVKIENIKFSRDSEEHIKPIHENDFSARHRYTVLLCNCETEESCTDLSQCKSFTPYTALIEKLGGICH